MTKNIRATTHCAVPPSSELAELLEQQTATSQVLQVINSSSGDLQPVFQIMLAKAVRLCRAKFGTLYLRDEGGLRLVAAHDMPAKFSKAHVSGVFEVAPGGALDGAMSTKRAIQLADLAATKAYSDRHPGMVKAVELGGIRTAVAVPILKEGELIGVIALHRPDVNPFDEKQITLLTSFAAQVVVAVENARLLNELRELNHQLEQRVADQVGEIERMSKLRRFLPPQVADLIVASGTEKQLESHRREITALFCDLRGFTGFSESSDPEDVMALLREYHAAIGQIIVKYSNVSLAMA
jgi:adenylate cyclase